MVIGGPDPHRSAQRSRRGLLGAALLMLVLTVQPGRADAAEITEGELHAAYVINFMRYTQWPEPPQSDEPYRLVVIGTAAEAAALRALAHGRTPINGRRLEIRHESLPERRTADATARLRDALANAHAVFVAPSHARWNRSVVRAAGPGVLTIGLDPGFTTEGGMLGMFNSNGRVVFAANVERLQQAGPMVSARVLSIARPAPGPR